MNLLIEWLITTLAIAITAYLLPGVVVAGFVAAVVAALVLGIVNVILKPLLVILTLPINIMTLGLFTLVINAFLILLTSRIVPGFEVAGFGSALLFGVVLAIIRWALETIAPPSHTPVP